MLPIGSRSRRLLNQSTHSSVANLTASKLRHGPLRWITQRKDKQLDAASVAGVSDQGEVLGTYRGCRDTNKALEEIACESGSQDHTTDKLLPSSTNEVTRR